MMLEYVHHKLVPKLIMKCENKYGCLFDNDCDGEKDTTAVDNNNTVAVSKI
jgi:hypothetical protein